MYYTLKTPICECRLYRIFHKVEINENFFIAKNEEKNMEKTAKISPKEQQSFFNRNI